MKGHLESLILQMYRSGIGYEEGLRQFQKLFVLTVLQDEEWNQLKAADKLGMHRNTLRRLVRDLGVDIRSLRATRRRPPESERLVPRDKKERVT